MEDPFPGSPKAIDSLHDTDRQRPQLAITNEVSTSFRTLPHSYPFVGMPLGSTRSSLEGAFLVEDAEEGLCGSVLRA